LLLAVAGGAGAHGTGRAAHAAVKPYGPHETVMGRTLTEWNRKWLRWEFSPSQKTTPLLHPGSCKHAEYGSVWLLPALAKTGVTLTCKVPSGTSLYVPTAGFFAWPDAHTTRQQLVPMARTELHRATVLQATVDGTAINVRPYADETGLLAVKAQPGSLMGAAGTHLGAGSVFNFLLHPLDPGRHVIRTHIKYVDPGQPPFEIRTTFRLTVA
jgi:hypothetical protein